MGCHVEGEAEDIIRIEPDWNVNCFSWLFTGSSL